LASSGRGTLIALAAAFVAAACAPIGSVDPQSPSPISTGLDLRQGSSLSPAASPGGVRPAREMSRAEAWPGVEPRSFRPHSVIPGLEFAYAGTTPDAAYHIGATLRGADGSGQPSRYQDVVLIDAVTQAVTVLHHLPTERHQLSFADADDRWVVWVEASSQPNFEDWTLYAYDRQSRQLSKVASAATAADGRPVPTPYVQPKVDRGRVVWSAGTADEPVGTSADSFIVDLATGQVRVLASRSIGARISWPRALVARPAADAPRSIRLFAIDLESGAETDLKVEDATYVAINGAALAWIDKSSSAVFVRDLVTGEQRPLVDYRNPRDQNDAPYLQFLSISERLVTWEQRPRGSHGSGGARAYDRKLDVVVHLSESLVIGYVLLKGSAVGWWDGRSSNDQPMSDVEIRFLNTKDLP